jgi:thiol-disulfide isomerase/thioredoxin
VAERYLLDTSAILTFTDQEDGADEIERILDLAKSGACWAGVCSASLMELYYISLQEAGDDDASQLVSLVKSWPVHWVWPDEKTLLLAGRIKALHRLSFADALIAAAAELSRAVLIHKDPEFEALAEEVKDVRSSLQRGSTMTRTPIENRIFPALLLAVALAACQPAGHPDVKVGLPVPAFELTAVDGSKVKSDSFLGAPVVLNFWATWCGPCLQEIPVLQAIERSQLAKVVAISIDEDPTLVGPFVERHGMDYTVLLGGPEVFARYNGSAVPYTLVLDSELHIVRMTKGMVSMRAIERDLRRAQKASES